MELSAQLHASTALPAGKDHVVPIGVWMRWRREKIPAPLRYRTPLFQPIAISIMTVKLEILFHPNGASDAKLIYIY
jgi:hypothetical protein